MKCLPMVLWVVACSPSVDESDDESSSSSGGEAGDPTTTPGTTSATTSPATTSMPTDTSTSASDGSSSSDDGTTADPDSSSGDEASTGEPTSTCVGFTAYASLGMVLAREGTTLDEPVCSATPASCGGELVGSWAVSTACGFEAIHNPFADDCPSSSFTVTSLDQTGTITFDDDGSYAQAITTTRVATMLVDAEGCFGATCDDLEQALAGAGENVCTGGDDACDCTVTTESDNSYAGTYELVDDGYVLTVDDQVSPLFPFCVTDDRLDTWSPITESTITETMCNELSDCEAALGDEFDAYVCVDIMG